MSIDRNKKLTVTEIQRFCMHDGPGIRTTVFLKGCPLRCAWCHNPETQSAKRELLFYTTKCIGCRLCESVCARSVHSIADVHKVNRSMCVLCGGCTENCPTMALEICGKEYSVDEIADTVMRDAAFYSDGGGMTLSGGEPFAHGMTVVDLLKKMKQKGISTAVETCGYADGNTIVAAIPYTDLFLWDIKDTDPDRHLENTGVSNEKIVENLRLADSFGAKTLLRCIIVKGVNSNLEHYRAIGRLALSLNNCEGVELIPYHAYSGTKATFIGRDDNGRRDWIPTDDDLNDARHILVDMGVNVK